MAGGTGRHYDVRLLGAPTFRCDGVPVRFVRRRSVAVAAYVLLERRLVSRRALAAMLWPDSRRGLANLRTVLTELRQRVPGLFVVDRAGIRPDPTCEADVDVLALGELAATARSAAGLDADHRLAAGLGHSLVGRSGVLLEGVELDGCDDFDRWLEIERRRTQNLRRTARQHLVAQHVEDGRLDRAIEVVALDAAEAAYDEAVNTELCRLLVRAGRRTEAVRHAESFRRRLEADLGVVAEVDLRTDMDAPDAPGLPARRALAADGAALIGRSAELQRVSSLLRRSRLVTLVGPGGSGKSRLAREVARRCTEARDGVVVVELRDVHDGDVAHTVAAALRLGLGPGAVADHVAAYLGPLDVLLVLDGVDPVLGAVSDLVDRILDNGRHAHVLVTSRHAVGSLGEVVVELPPMPPMEARVLLVDRLRDGHGLDLADSDTIDKLDRICASLDGLPFGVEVVAPQLRACSIDAVVGEVERLPVVAGATCPVVDLGPVADLLDWSIRLQAPAVRHVFTALGAFAGSFDADAVAAVSGVDREDVPAVLEQLVAHSLVTRVDDGGRPRWQLLRLVAHHARRLASGRMPELRRRHAEHFHARVAGLDLFDLRDADVVAAMAPDLENHAAAFEHQAGEDRWSAATEIAVGCYGIFSSYGWTRRGREWLERCLDHGAGVPRETLESARAALVQLCLVLDDADGVEHHGALLAGAADPRIRAESTGTRALPILQTDPTRAAALLEAAIDALQEPCPAGSWVWPRAYLGFQSMYAGDLHAARQQLDTSISEARALGHTSHLWILEDAAASCELLLGLPHAVLRRLHGLRRPDTFWDAGRLLTGLARLMLGDLEGGRDDVLAFADPAERRRLPRSANDALVGLAAVAAAEGRRDAAIEILGNAGRGRMPASIGVGRRLAARLDGIAEVERLRCRLEDDGLLYASADDLLAREWHAARAREAALVPAG